MTEMTEKVLRGLYPTYPRNVGNPLQFPVNSFEELLDFIKQCKSKKRAFAALYDKTRFIDKIWVDLDRAPYEQATKLHAYLQKHDYKHLIVLSGEGYHFYIITTKEQLKSPKMALKNCHNWLEKEADIVIDRQVKGDIGRVATIPTTFNLKRGRYAIFVSQKMLDAGHATIKQQALVDPVGEIEFFGSKPISLVIFDQEWDDSFADIGDSPYPIDQETLEKSVVLQKMPPCIQRMASTMSEGGSSFRERFFVLHYLFKKGFDKEQATALFKEILPERKFFHVTQEENQIEKVWNERYKYFISCKLIKDFEYCTGCEEEI